MSDLRISELAPGLVCGPRVEIADDVRLGAHVVLHADTHIAGGVLVQDAAVVGKPPRLGPRSSASGAPERAVTRLGAGATVCAGAIVMAGATVEDGAIVGDHAYMRELSVLGPGSVLGQAAALGAGARVGARVRIQNTSKLVAGAIVEDDVFVGPSVTTTNDATAGRRGPGTRLAPVTLRRACRIGAGVILMPGVEIGEEAVVGAGALVIGDVPARTVVIGSPARHMRSVRPDEMLGAGEV